MFSVLLQFFLRVWLPSRVLSRLTHALVRGKLLELRTFVAIYQTIGVLLNLSEITRKNLALQNYFATSNI